MNENNSGLPITGVPEIANSRAAKVLCQEGGRLYQMPISSLEKNIFSDMDTLKEYGVKYSSKTKSYSLVRMGAAKGKIVEYGIGTSPAVNDFDKIYPFSHMKRCTLADDGTVTAYAGDANYVEDGSIGQVMMKYPPTYFKREHIEYDDGEFDDIFWFCKDKLDDKYYMPECFFNEAGELLDAVYLAVYPISLDENDKPCSVINGEVKVCKYKDMQNIIANRGANWHNWDLSEYSMYAMLFMIEYATTNSESVFSGAYKKVTDEIYCDVEDYYNSRSNEFVTTRYNSESLNIPFCKGQRIILEYWIAPADYPELAEDGDYTDDKNNELLFVSTVRKVVSVEAYNGYIIVTFDGKPIVVDKDTMIWIDDATGVTRNITSPSGIIGNLPAGMSPFKYRGIENPFSTEYTWVSGIVVREGKYYVTTDITKYGEFESDYKFNLSDYREVDITIPTEQGYISKLGFDANVPWAIMPTETNGGSEECYCDNFLRPMTFNNRYDYVLRFGSNTASAGGLLSASCNYTDNYHYMARGRLAYRHYR